MSAGTIVAFSHGNNRYLELQSSSRKNEFRFHYVSRRDGKVYVETFPFHLNDGDWHRVALSVSGSQVELLVDCHPLYRRLLKGPPDTNFTLPQLELWVGQRYIKHSPFRGDLQEVQLIAGPHGYLIQCPQLDSSCPTCGQFSILQNTVEQLMYNLNELTRRLAVAEGRISKVEECECQKSCRVNGTVHEDGATWLKDCQECSCVHGEIECRPMSCSPADCKNPTIPEGKCCPVCLKQCFMDGASRIYDHGEKMTPKRCIECTCHDGNFKCLRFTDSKCPPLPCPPSEQISVADECCKFCPGVDYCAKGHTCHANASCLNLQTTYACHCDIGFQGDGLNCHDVDECKQQGGSNGHHCNANTICVNVEGSYTCECLPGYDRIDKFNCADLDECATGYHHCDKHATCVNTAGSYYCICNEGYTGDGYTCKPVCTQTCQNGGECVAPERCSCRRGFIGNSCELDLDECASDLHRCHDSSSMCHNMPGWYYCRCKDGYRPALHYSTQGTQCVDIDECTDVTVENKHTCHPSAKCVNNEGGYKCVCPTDLEESEQECSLNCWFEDREVNNGESVAPANNSCSICTCQDGVISCKDPVCDCSIPGSHMNKCCPQCDPKASCRHQELHHLVFRSKERWIYQCQTCECMRGEIDCWPLECPPVTCSDPVTENGDCCPRCHDDPCGREVPTNGISLTVPSHPRPCSYAGVIHSSGSSWQDPHDKCTTCECKDGQLCCSYDYGCADDLGDKKQRRPANAVREPFVHHLSDTAVQSLVDDSPKTAVPAVTGTLGTARTITPAVITSVASTTFPVSSPTHYSSSTSISNDNTRNLRRERARGLDVSQSQRFVGSSTTSPTESEQSTTPSSTTARTRMSRSSLLRRNHSTSTAGRHGNAVTASSFSSSLSSPTLAVVLASTTEDHEHHNRSSRSVSAHIRQLVEHRRKNSRKSSVLDSAT
ncbi:protein kinase C-binding protein NELL1-like isoform X2 [Pseudomyrmex gracilis]|uniref:protein kinase C-binding protein NELL1-like isoform X2 n=1 Tax=Pseudomyrmex gracilis TaxID=219809 RepID=UPI00099564BB|nr:protein kinase C-binding protein NELL1-like isoform X2 [Pseudomyrmex gracilis]